MSKYHVIDLMNNLHVSCDTHEELEKILFEEWEIEVCGFHNIIIIYGNQLQPILKLGFPEEKEQDDPTDFIQEGQK